MAASKKSKAKTKAPSKSETRRITVQAEDDALVYYGPYPCKDTQIPRRKGNTGCDQLIVKAGNQASHELEFNAQAEHSIIYPNTHKGLEWTLHTCKK